MATMRLKADYQQLNPDHPHRHEGKSSYMYGTVVHILVICVKNLTYLRQRIMSLQIHKYQEPQLKRVRLDVSQCLLMIRFVQTLPLLKIRILKYSMRNWNVGVQSSTTAVAYRREFSIDRSLDFL